MSLAKLFRLLNLYPGEGRSVLFLCFFAFTGALAVSCGCTLSEGTFLEVIGADSLSYSYVCSGALLSFLSFGLLKAFNRHSSTKILFTFFGLALSVYLSLVTFLPSSLIHTKEFSFLYKISTEVLFISFTLGFWNFVDEFYDMQDAKRIYCFFNASILFGTACGGALISTFLDSIGMRGIFLCIMSSFLIATSLLYFTRKSIPKLTSEDVHEELQKSDKLSTKTSLKAIFRSPFTLFFLSSFLVSQIILILATYGYMDSFEVYYTAKGYSEGDLTEFLGACTFWVAIGNMAFGMLCYSRLVRTIGISNIVLITPMVFTLLYTGWSFSSNFAWGLLGLLTVEGLWFSLDENTCNVIVNVVPPRCKKAARVAIDTFFEPLGMLICGLALIGMHHVKDAHATAYFGLTLALILLLLVFLVRRSYKPAVFHNLSQNSLAFHKSAEDWLTKLPLKEQQKAYFQFLCSLRSRDEASQIFSFNALLAFKDTRLLPHLVNQLNHFSIRNRIKAVEALSETSFASHKKILDLMHAWIRYRHHPTLTALAYRYLAEKNALPRPLALRAFNNPSLEIHGAGILSLHQLPDQKAQAEKALEELLSSSQEDRIIKGLEILSFLDNKRALARASSFFGHASNRVFSQAVLTVALKDFSHEETQARTLISNLPEVHSLPIRYRILKELKVYRTPGIIQDLLSISHCLIPRERRLVVEIIQEMGEKALEPLLRIVKDPHYHDRERLLAGKTLGSIAPKKLREELTNFIQEDIQRAYFYLFHAKSLEKSTLEEILRTRHHSLIDFIIQVVGISGNLQDHEALSRSLNSDNQKIHSNALETLEEICPKPIFRLLYPLVEDCPEEHLKSRAMQQGLKALSLEELIHELLESPFVLDRIVASQAQKEHALSQRSTPLALFNTLKLQPEPVY